MEGCYNCKLLTVGVNGLVALDQSRRYNKTDREMTRENIEGFRARKGYDPVRADGKDRWI